VLEAILMVQEALKRFGPEGGSVINLSSIVGSHPVAGAVLYASSRRTNQPGSRERSSAPPAVLW
jgi:NAD(P)-dependent dehydrogenase (short-subunit alcohol dehydrogenase family)